MESEKFNVQTEVIHQVNPKISVLVPVYNAGLHLNRCIDSLLAQTFKNFEIWLINDGSTDNSGNICNQFAKQDARIHVIHTPNKGVSEARNTALKYAKGEYIRYCDADDWFAPDMLERMYDTAIHQQADIVLCDFSMVYADKEIRNYTTDWNDNKIESLNRYIASTWTCVAMMLIKKSLFVKYNLQSPLGITYCEDFHLAIRLCFFANKVFVIHEPFYFYNQMNTSSTMYLMQSGKNSRRTMQNEIAVYLDIIDFFKQQNQYANFEKVMCWRILKAKQDLILDIKSWNEFLKLTPESKNYIFSCPFINSKLKIMMWCLTHHLKAVTAFIVLLRKVLGK